MAGQDNVVCASLSARRAWIEIWKETNKGSMKFVALRKESVDRNIKGIVKQPPQFKSLSARRAWIEISSVRWCWTSREVALRKESVDRNFAVHQGPPVSYSRSPQGERG